CCWSSRERHHWMLPCRSRTFYLQRATEMETCASHQRYTLSLLSCFGGCLFLFTSEAISTGQEITVTQIFSAWQQRQTSISQARLNWTEQVTTSKEAMTARKQHLEKFRAVQK